MKLKPDRWYATALAAEKENARLTAVNKELVAENMDLLCALENMTVIGNAALAKARKED